MKTAILIMAHDQPTHLAKLVEFLSCDWIHIFIHIDRKFDITQFFKCVPQDNNTTFLEDQYRIEVNWGGFSQVQATLNLLHVSLNCQEHFTRFCLLSGSDFPIKSLNVIKVAFNSDQEFIQIGKRINIADKNSQVDFVKYYHFADSPFSEITVKPPKITRKVYDKISLYHGSQWWSLTHGCVKYIKEFLQRNNDYLVFHKHTFAPDEIFFHSIVKSSPFAADITHDFEKANTSHKDFKISERGCHYVEWITQKSFVRKPKVLDEDDLENLLSSQALFARKFRTITSDNLLQMIEKFI